MTANKHTPGPWTLWGRADPSQVIASESGFVAQTVGGNDEANARLIAAAPELLELARELWVDVRHNNEEDEPYGQRVQAVIAKATGETP